VTTTELSLPSLLHCNKKKRRQWNKEGEGNIATNIFFATLQGKKKEGDNSVVAIAFFTLLQQKKTK
jgi:hypothetical protein